MLLCLVYTSKYIKDAHFFNGEGWGLEYGQWKCRNNIQVNILKIFIVEKIDQ